jgi:transcriptional regulator with XRE-family HTH domain
MPGKKNLDQDLSQFQKLLKRLLEESGENYSEAARASGLHYTTISKYMGGVHPMRDACIALADHFGINPNVMLEAAGYKPLRFFDREKIDLSQVRPEAKKMLEQLERITDPKRRDHLYQVINSMLEGYQLAEQGEEAKAEAKNKAKSVPELGAGS